MITWDAAKNSQGYNIRWGIAPDKLYNSWLLYGKNELLLKSLSTDQPIISPSRHSTRTVYQKRQKYRKPNNLSVSFSNVFCRDRTICLYKIHTIFDYLLTNGYLSGFAMIDKLKSTSKASQRIRSRPNSWFNLDIIQRLNRLFNYICGSYRSK